MPSRPILPPDRASPLQGSGSSLLGGAVSGLLLAAATAPLAGLGPLAFVALVPWLLVTLRAGRLREGALAGAACGVVFFGLGFLWVPWSVGGAVLDAAFALGVPLLALPLTALALCASALALRGRPGLALAALPAAWAGLEALRAAGPLGVPWLRLGSALAAWPALAQPAALGGPALLTGWIIAANALLASAALGLARGAGVGALGVVAGGALLGVARIPAVAPAPAAGHAARIVAVQPDLTPGERRVAGRFDANLGRLLDLSEQDLALAPDLIVWPEGSFERTAGPAGAPFLGAVAHQLGVPVLAGLRRRGAGGGPLHWNSAALATPDGETRIAGDKVRPVPVYERAADFALAHALARAGWWPGHVRAARAPGLIDLPLAHGGGVRLGLLLCIDAAHPELARDLRRRGAELLVSPANEAESGAWSARQHAALARLRAIETGLPLVRVANTGPSQWIDPWGRELARLEAGRPGSALAALPSPAPPTPWVRHGAAPTWLLLLSPPLLGIPRRVPRGARSSAREPAGPARRGRSGGGIR